MNELLFTANPAVRALGFTLVHSLWQAVLIAVVAAIFFKKTASADGRYRLGLGALLAVFASAVATFFYYFEIENGSAAGAVGTKILHLHGNAVTLAPGISPAFSEPTFFEKTANWFEANHAFIVGIWLIGAVFFLVKLLGGWWFANRMKTRQVRPILADYAEILADLLKKMPNPRPVKLFESALAAVPMTLGWLQPVILLPIGLVNHLTIEEVEFVLAHELAHIVRRDWIFNLGQAFIEAVFYFNPAVWWLSARIREERENVADDLALRITEGSAIGYAKALVRVQEAAFGQFQPALALAFSTKKGPNLLGRVQRIIFQQPQSNNASMEKMIATGLIIALAAGLSLRANPAKPVVEKLAELATNPIVFFQNAVENRDSIAPKPPVKIKGDGFVTINDDGKTLKIGYEKGKINSLNVNGEEIPESDFEKYDQLIAESLASIPTPPAPVSLEDLPTPPHPVGFPAPPFPPSGFSAHWDFPELGFLGKLDDITMSGTMSLDDDQEFSTTDDQGRVHIYLNGKGMKNEVFIDGEKAFLNGKPLENGQKLQILKKNDPNNFIALTGSGHVFQLKNGELFWNPQDGNLKKQLAEAHQIAEEDHRRAAREQVRQMEAEHREMGRQHEIDRRIEEKEARAAEQEARAADREVRAAERDLQRLHELDAIGRGHSSGYAFSSASASPEVYAFSSGSSAPQVFTYANSSSDHDWLRELLASDGFDQKKFSVKLDDKLLKINGKKQSAEMHEKYLDAYRDFGGGNKGNTFEIKVSGKSISTSVSSD